VQDFLTVGGIADELARIVVRRVSDSRTIVWPDRHNAENAVISGLNRRAGNERASKRKSDSFYHFKKLLSTLGKLTDDRSDPVALDVGELSTKLVGFDRNIDDQCPGDLSVGAIVDWDGERGADIAALVSVRVVVDDVAVMNITLEV
jgi:hypothetical protein